MNSKSKVRLSNSRMLRAAVTASMAVACANAYADATANIAVSASVANTCSISASPMAFGAYNAVTKAVINIEGAVTVTCTAGFTTPVRLDMGLHPAGADPAVPLRRMANVGGAFLIYQLYTEPARTTPWEGVTGVSHVGSGAAIAHPMYGQVPAGQNPATGAYTDTVVATVTF
jgi:spore coat protein U-like protein